MNDPGRVVILGAGPTGIGAAHRLRELGIGDFLVIDRCDAPGGLASSFVDAEGFTWDVGGHVQFSHYAYYDDVLDRLPIEWLNHQREAWVRIRKRFVPYPFQNNIGRLDHDDRERILSGMEQAALAREMAAPPQNFGEWILHVFGSGMADIFLVPYNRKVWAYPPEELDLRWMGERVSMPDLVRVRENIASGKDDVSWGPNNTFRFPKHGGTGSIWRALGREVLAGNGEFGDEAIAVDAAERSVRLRSGRTLRYDTLISTLPLPELCRRTGGIRGDVAAAAESLMFSSTHVFGIGLRGRCPESLSTKCWMYFPEANSPYYRVTVFSNYSPFNVPQGEEHWSLMAEVSESPAKPVRHGSVFDEVITALRDDALLPGDAEIVSRWYRFERYGYPTPSLGRDRALAVLRPELDSHRIFSRGRFGAWKYEVSNQDHSFMQGVEVVDRLTGGGEEPTLDRPDYVNGGAFVRRRA